VRLSCITVRRTIVLRLDSDAGLAGWCASPDDAVLGEPIAVYQ